MTPFEVHLDAYHGPLDLLLYLVRKQEVPIAELPLSRVAEQYLEHVAVLERIDPDAAGDFLDTASMLLELKSRSVLPDAEEAADGDPLDDTVDGASDLVERLLQFKQYRDAAAALEARRSDWSQRFTRLVSGGPRRSPSQRERAVEPVELWYLVSAFARVLRERQAAEPEAHTLRLDETPVHVHMQRIDEQLRAHDGETPFDALFPVAPVSKSTLVAVFLAVLELVRYGHALAHQPEAYGPITVRPGAKPYVPPADISPARATAP